MTVRNRKANDKLDFLNARLDAVRMADYERIRAKAQLARAEAMADLIAAIGRGLRSLLRTLVVRPIRRLTASLG